MTQHRLPRGSTVLAAILPTAVLLAPTAAHAQTPAAPAPAPAPVTMKLTLVTEKARSGEALKGDEWRALAVTKQYVAGTKVRLRFTAAKKGTVTRTLTLRPAKKGDQGYVRFTVPVKMQGSSRVVVRAAILAGQPIAPTAARTRVVLQASPNVSPGERGLAVRILQEMLAAKAYVTGAKGVYDARTARAVLAFRKVAGMSATEKANSSVFRALRAGKGTFKVRFPSHGRHVEGDVDRRVLVLVNGGRPERIYHTSPGKPSTPTIRGSFRVYRKDPGTNALGMYRSVYFIRGYAIHGYPSVPAGYSASHGCFRVPMADAAFIYGWMTMGMRVDTY